MTKIATIRRLLSIGAINGILLILLILLPLAVVLAITIAFTEDPCNLFVLQQASETQRNVVFSCSEFWINRYQSLAGSVLTASVAFITLAWLTRQLTAANRQAAVAAAQGLRVRLEELNSELTTYRAIAGRCTSIQSNPAISEEITGIRSLGRDVIEAFVAIKYYEEFIVQHTDDIIGQNPEGGRFSDIVELMGYAFGIRKLLGAWIVNHSTDETADRVDILVAAGKIQIDDLATAFNEVKVKVDRTADLIEKLEKAVLRERVVTWTQIRRFERSAVDGT